MRVLSNDTLTWRKICHKTPDGMYYVRNKIKHANTIIHFRQKFTYLSEYS